MLDLGSGRLLRLLVFLEDGNVAHGTTHRLKLSFFVKLASMPAHPDVQPLIEPYPDATLMELVLARCRNHLLGTLLQSLLADAAVGLISELESTLNELKRLHELFECFFLRLAPLDSWMVVSVCSTARLSPALYSTLDYSESKAAALHLATF